MITTTTGVGCGLALVLVLMGMLLGIRVVRRLFWMRFGGRRGGCGPRGRHGWRHGGHRHPGMRGCGHGHPGMRGCGHGHDHDHHHGHDHDHHHGHSHGHDHDHDHGGAPAQGRLSPEARAKAAAEAFKRHIGASAEQGDIIDHALRDLADARAQVSAQRSAARQALAAALGGEQVDEPGLHAALEQQAEAAAISARAATSALKQVHAVLDADQRAAAAAWMAGAMPGWAGGRGDAA